MGFRRDLFHEARQLLKHHNYTAVAVLVLSVSIGANTLMFSGANALLFRPLPFDDSPRVVHVQSTNPRAGFEKLGISPPDFADLKEHTRSFDSLSALYIKMETLASPRGDPERLLCSLNSADLLRTLRVQPILGRHFTAEDDQPNSPKVAIVSYGLWERRFAKDQAIIGSTVNLDGELYAIVGVMPRGFWFPSRSVELWLPLRLDPLRAQRSDRFLTVIGSLKNGITPANAQPEAAAVASDLASRYTDTNAGWGIAVTPLRDDRLSDLARTALFVLLIAVAFVLLIAAANVANLLLAQMTARRRELAIRASLGAGRWRLVRQILAQSALLAVLGAAGGMAFTIVVRPLLTSAIPPYLRDYNDLVIDYRVLAYNMVLPLLTMVACAFVPAVQLSTPSLNDILQRTGEKGGTDAKTSRDAFHVLLVAEVALSITMIIGAGLAIRGFLHLASFDFGFEANGVLTFRVELPGSSYGDRFQQDNFFKRLIAECEALPGVLNVSATDVLPISGRVRRSAAIVAVHVPGETLRNQHETISVARHIVMPEYFEAMRIPLLSGRTFTPSDRRDGRPVAVVSETLARQYLARRNPIGAQLEIGSSQRVEVVGVVGSIWAEGPGKNPLPEIYVPYAQNVAPAMTVVARTAGNPEMLAPGIRRRVREMDRLLPVDEMETMDVVVGESYAGPHVFIWICGVFAAIALAIAAAGMYSVVSYYVSCRTREMGIRMALGAEPKHIYRLVMRYVMLGIVLGTAIGIPAGIGLSHGMKRLLFGISPFDPIVYTLLGAFLAIVTALASYGPTRRATRIDPATSIR